MRKYRFWPVYILAFLRPLYFSIYSLALPNYLLYNTSISPSLLGIIMAAFPFSYIVGPPIGQKITEKIGVRNAIILSTVISSISIVVQISFLIPAVLIIARILDGLFLGLFWPNLQYEITKWRNRSSPEYAPKYFQRYSSSWNYGLLVGYIFGYLLVLLIKNDFIGMLISMAICFIMIPAALYLEKPHRTLHFYKNIPIIVLSGSILSCSEFNEIKDNEDSSEKNNHDGVDGPEKSIKQGSREDNSYLAYSIMLSYVSVLFYALFKGLIGFNVPIILKYNGEASYWAYLVNFSVQVIQTIFIRKTSLIGYKKGLKNAILCYIIIAFLVIVLFFKPILPTIFLIYILMGMCSTFIYSFGTQLMLEYGTITKSSKYANRYETFAGVGFAFGPFLAGFIADFDPRWVYGIASIFSFSAALIIFTIKSKFKKPLN